MYIRWEIRRGSRVRGVKADRDTCWSFLHLKASCHAVHCCSVDLWPLLLSLLSFWNVFHCFHSVNPCILIYIYTDFSCQVETLTLLNITYFVFLYLSWYKLQLLFSRKLVQYLLKLLLTCTETLMMHLFFLLTSWKPFITPFLVIFFNVWKSIRGVTWWFSTIYKKKKHSHSYLSFAVANMTFCLDKDAKFKKTMWYCLLDISIFNGLE